MERKNRLIIIVLLGGMIAAMAFFRLIPFDPASWHVPVAQTADADLAGGAVRVIADADGRLSQIDSILMEMQRTDRLAGSVEDGRITYVTHSRVFGFPDYTTVERAGDQIRMFARLRFGASDLGVNRARLERVIAALDQG